MYQAQKRDDKILKIVAIVIRVVRHTCSQSVLSYPRKNPLWPLGRAYSLWHPAKLQEKFFLFMHTAAKSRPCFKSLTIALYFMQHPVIYKAFHTLYSIRTNDGLGRSVLSHLTGG